MKKLSFILALILVCGALAACGDDSDNTTTPKNSSNPPKQSDSSKTPAKTTQKPSTTKPGGADTTKPAQTTQPSGEEQPQDELIDGSKFTVDGDLSDWEGLATMKVQGEASTSAKSATFYGAMTTTGLYLACDAYHDVYTTGKSNWFENTNFELFISESGEQVYAYAAGLDADCLTGTGDNATCQITEAVMKTTEINDATKYHTITEVFIANESLPEYAVYLNTVGIGMGWKTPGDFIIGGQYHVNEDGSDEYWGVKGDEQAQDGDHAIPRCAMVATPKGLYWFDDYFTE